MTVTASYTDGQGTAESVASSATSAVTNIPVTLASNNSYNATAGVDVFVIDANVGLTNVTISGFGVGDIIRIDHHSDILGVSFISDFSTAAQLLVNSNAQQQVDLVGMSSFLFVDEASFEAIYGPNAITYVV